MSKKLKLTKIELETKDGKKVELSLTEAKELHDQLHDLFGEKYVPSTPIVIERDRYWPNPYRPYWYYHVTSDAVSSAGAPKHGGLGVQCKLEGNSGLNVTYSGRAL